MTDDRRYRALSFDCYGTLIDWETGIAAELVPWADQHGIAAGQEELLAAFGGTETGVEQEHPTMRYPDVLGVVLDRIAARFGTTATAAERESFGSSVPRWPAFPDSAEALARLHERCRLVILSNIDRGSFAASQEILETDFDLVITAEDVGSYKPDPANFAALVEGVGGLGISSDELLHVAESLYHDHEPARAIGLDSVWIHRRHDRAGSHGATAPPADPGFLPQRRYASLSEFADAFCP
jgi:2-haloalkanoic acid dehalogenase type II